MHVSKLNCSYYAQSKELKIIYELMFPGREFDEFMTRPWPGPNLSIHKDFYSAREALQIHEPDFALRQLLFFLKPSIDFRAWKNCVKSIECIKKALCDPQYKLKEGDIPFGSLLRTAKRIEALIEEHYPQESIGELFPQFHLTKSNQNLNSSQECDDNDNPLFGKSSSTYPLYSILFNKQKRLISASPITGSSNPHIDTDLSYAIFLSHFYCCANERRQLPINRNRNRNQGYIDRDIAYQNPYGFLLQVIGSTPDHSKLKDMERLIRNASKNWPFYPLKRRELLEKLIARPYGHFLRACTLLLLNPLLKDPADQELIDLKLLFQFFSEMRRSGGGSRERKGIPVQEDGPVREDHPWFLPPVEMEPEEDVYGNPIQVFRLEDVSISPERAAELEDLGEHPLEDSMGEVSIEVLFIEDGAASELKLEKHTSHTQLLLATQNQRLSWMQSNCTDEEMASLMEFLRSKEGWAPMVLLMIIILAIDLEMVLNVEMGPAQDYQWLRGKSYFRFEGVKSRQGKNEPLRICTIHQDQVDSQPPSKGASHNNPSSRELLSFAAWVYPIPLPALKKHADIASSDEYAPHLSTLAFADQSGIAQALINKCATLGDKSLTPVFTIDEKNTIRKQCRELLKQFNRELNDGIILTKGKRNISLGSMREYGTHYLVQAGFEPALVDNLDWNLPSTSTPATHYFTTLLWKKPKFSDWGIQYHLSSRTALFYQEDRHPLPGISNDTIGATGLVKIKPVRAFIQKLISDVKLNPLTIESEGDVTQFIAAFNSYSLYMALWFCMETSHRPHHTPFADVTRIDPLHNLIKLKDKSNEEGDKFRLAWVSEPLREEMQRYAETVSHLISWSAQQDVQNKAPTSAILIFLEPDERSSQHFRIQPLESRYFSKQIRGNLKVEANFYRKLNSSLLRSLPIPVSVKDVEYWLGHWTHGTAPYHLFSAASPLSYIKRMEGPLREVISSLGFEAIPFKMPSFSLNSIKTRVV